MIACKALYACPFSRGFASIAFVTCGVFAMLQCRSEPSIRKTAKKSFIPISREKQLISIKTLYKPLDCFTSSFRLRAKSPRRAGRNASGRLKVDNKHNRIKFIFQDPIFGMTLSRVIIADEMVYVRNSALLGGRPRQKFPLKRFEVRGLGGNSIRLPFRIFQDLLFARMPQELFDPGADVKKLEEGKLEVVLDKKVEKYRYIFLRNRLRRLMYNQKEEGIQVEVELIGTYQKSMFPEQMRMLMRARKGGEESMSIRFTGFNPAAQCRDSDFRPM